MNRSQLGRILLSSGDTSPDEARSEPDADETYLSLDDVLAEISHRVRDESSPETASRPFRLSP